MSIPKQTINYERGEAEERLTLNDYDKFDNVKEYYEYFADSIGFNQFAFKGGIYKANCNTQKIMCIKHEDAKMYIRVIGDFYKYVTDSITGRMVLRGWDIKAINIDYGHVNGFKKMIDAFDGFCVQPSNTHFERVINNHFNMYEPIHHIPKEGKFPYIEMYFQHIFGDNFLEMAYDYFSILWRIPTQKLPVPALVSEETGTGKSTMIDFMRAIWGDNAVMIGNSEISSEFNTTYASKLIVGIDEGFIDKKTVLEKIKSLVTRPSLLLNDKNVKVKEIPCHLHFLICTNNETSFVKMEGEDSRFWVLKIKGIPQEERIYNLLEKMVGEIPAFLWFLENREYSIPKEDRLWFAPHRFDTEAKQVMIEASLPKNVRVLKEFLDEFFEKTGQTIVNFTKTDLNEIFKREGGNSTFDHNFMKRYIKYEKANKARLDERSYPYTEPAHTVKELQRYFTFFAEDYLSAELFRELHGDTLSGTGKAPF